MKQKPIPDALMPFLEGKVLLIDKPIGWTSFDIVKKVRNLTRVIKVGHAGTLDPLATGLLIVCTGKYTKSIDAYMGMQKEYTGTMVLGATTPTYDLESEPAYLRKKQALDAAPHSSESQVSRFTLGEENGEPQIRPNNSFLHDNVD